MIRAQRPRGILLAGAIGAAWLLSLAALLSLDLARVPATCLVLGVLVRSLLQTGLFIIGHDAIHGLLLPAHRGMNHRLGALVLSLYAALPYERCRQNHLQHHRVPGTSEDPDFQAADSSSVISWYARFLGGYLSTPQMLLLLGAWGLLALATSALHVLLFCTVPLLISSWQLFAVGTYLPHRAPSQGDDDHHAISLDLPEWLSLLACFHFGYHWEHHAYPHLAWYELPGSRRARSHHGYAIGSRSWNRHHQTGRKKSRRWPKPPLPLPTTGPSMG